MCDSELTERPGRDWTRWAEGVGEYEIERTWWRAKVLHFPKLNVSVWFDGSERVDERQAARDASALWDGGQGKRLLARPLAL